MITKSTSYRVLLVNAPTHGKESAAGNYAVFPAMGTVNLATRIMRDYPGVAVKVVDGGIRTTEEIRRAIDEYRPSLLAISVLTPTYKQGLELASYAKEALGSTTVLGNDHASFFPALILEKRPYIDYVVQAEFGEEALSYIVGLELGASPKLRFANPRGRERIHFRNTGGSIRSLSFRQAKLSEIINSPDDIPDLSLISDELSEYARAFNEKYSAYHKSERRPSVINNVRGCGNGEYRCTYCGIYDLSLNAGKPSIFWETVRRHNEEHGINFFFEVCDSFLTFQSYIKQLIKLKPFEPEEKGIEFEVYARANDVVNIPEAVNWLRQLNVARVNLGLDSGDDNMLALLRKRNQHRKGLLTPSQINYEAVRKLADAGITIHASFPLGSLGETEESLAKTADFIERIAEDFAPYLATLEASVLVPLPNSPAWDMLLSRNNSAFSYRGGLERMLEHAGISISEKDRALLRSKYLNKDLLDMGELARDWVKHFTHVEWEMIEEAESGVKEIAGSIGAVYGQAI